MFFARSLSGRLLSLTVVIVMMTEVFVFLPSVARFRQDFLLERLQMAQIASLALLAADDAMVEEALEAELLANAEVSSIVLRRDSARQLVLSVPSGAQIAATYDLRDASAAMLIVDSLAALFRTEQRIIRVIGEPVLNAGEVIEITLAEAALCRAIRSFSQRILLLSLIISVITGILVFFICRWIIVRPIEQVIDNMVAFQNAPETAQIANGVSSSIEEIGRAEAALGEMQEQVRSALKQKTRLAELGTAVAKINHDLRNMLSSAQLMADRLEGSADPLVAKVGPKLIGSLDRAVSLCLSTLTHGKAEEAPPEPRRVALCPLIYEVAESIFTEDDPVQFQNAAPEGAEVLFDPDHLFRILSNLVRNARQAIESSGRGDRVRVEVKVGEKFVLRVMDNGPGMPAKAQEHIFQPFRGGVRRGGSGLGLAIAAELAAANGADLVLSSSTTEGTVFRLSVSSKTKQ
ncbi:MAG: sensor histidine kinase [Pikeienuella sp.]